MNANRKKYKQLHHLKDVQKKQNCIEEGQAMDFDYIKKNVVVCDGGDNESDSIQNRLDIDGVNCL